jgi:hypothetical protein
MNLKHSSSLPFTRRSLLALASAAALVPATLPSLALAQGRRALKVVSPWEVANLDPSTTSIILLREPTSWKRSTGGDGRAQAGGG